jgi:hypothetical protein
MVSLEDDNLLYWKGEVDRLLLEIESGKQRLEDLHNSYLYNYDQIDLPFEYEEDDWMILSEVEHETYSSINFTNRFMENLKVDLENAKDEYNNRLDELKERWEQEGVARWLS